MSDLQNTAKSGAYRALANKYREAGLSTIPIDEMTKAPPKKAISRNWQANCYALTSQEKTDRYISECGDDGIGLLLGLERKPGYVIAAIDVDRDDLVRVTNVVLGDCPSSKFGQKGRTFFGLAEKGMKSTKVVDIENVGVIDILLGGKQTVLPPSIHPKTKKPYIWVGRELLDCTDDELPIWTERKFKILQKICKHKELQTLLSGKTTHDAGVSLSASLVSVGCSDEEILEIFKAILPENYSSDSLEELPGWINSARAKKFDAVDPDLPLDESVALAVAQRHDPLVFTVRDGFLHYRDGVWENFSENAFCRSAKEIALPRLKAGRQVASLLTNICRCAALNLEVEGFGDYPDKICLRNGTLDVLTGELLAWSPDHELRYKLDINYDPNAKCPFYEEQLYATLCDGERAVETFEEFAGLSLISDLSFQKAMYLVGPGGSGKSTLLKIVEAMHCPDAISVTPLDKIDSERYLTDLAGKLICISFDVQTDSKIFGDAFTRITGGDFVATRKLYGEVQGRVRPTVRFMGCMNLNMPRFIAAPDALERRLIFLNCGQKIEQPDPDRLVKLLKERPGILNRWIAALQRLKQRKRFDLPKPSIEAVEAYVNTQDPVRIFIDDALVIDNAARTPIADLLREYTSWSSETNERPLSSNVLGRRLKAAGLGFSFGKDKVTGVSVRTYHVRIKRNSHLPEY